MILFAFVKSRMLGDHPNTLNTRFAKMKKKDNNLFYETMTMR